MKIERIIGIVEETVKEVFEDNVRIIFHADGEIANDDESLESFIVSTNQKYHRSNSKKLIGNFLEICFTDTSFLRIDINDLKKCKSEKELAEYVNEQLNYAKSISVNAGDIVSKMENYSEIQNSLIIRPLHYDEQALSEYVYIKVEDMALILYALVSDDTESISTVKIPKKIFEKWDMSKENVFSRAMLNTQVKADARIYSEIPRIDYDGEKLHEISSLNDDSVPLVTTERKTNGAIAMFFPNVKERIAELFQDSYYIVFTSIHEAVLHKKGTVSLDIIKRSLNDVNNRFANEDTLTNYIYLYDRDSKKLSVAI